MAIESNIEKRERDKNRTIPGRFTKAKCFERHCDDKGVEYIKGGGMDD